MVEETPPVVQRVKLLTEHFTKTIAKDPTKKKVAFLLKRITEEAIDEMADAPEAILEYYMKEATAMLAWAATGEIYPNMPLPEDFNAPEELSFEAGQQRKELEA